MISTGLDRLLADREALAGRRYGLLTHAAAVDADLVPAHLALARSGRPPALLFGPEHGLHGVEQDHVASGDAVDPWTGVPVRSLYGASESSLEPAPEAFDGLDLLVVDLQDVGVRYYTYAATAVWAAEAALAAGCEVWVLDRPNPLGGAVVEGNLRRSGFESFVGAFRLPVRHGLTLAELVRLEAARRGWPAAPRVWRVEGWRREMEWEAVGRPWVAPSPNLPSMAATRIYAGACLVEATALSEGRGTASPFELLGGPGLDPVALADRLAEAGIAGARFVPTLFRPHYQKHAGKLLGGVRWVVTDPARLRPYAAGVRVLAELRRAAGDRFAWRRDPYEFVTDRPAIDLLAGDDALRRALEGDGDLDVWIAGWQADEAAFRAEREPILLY